MIIDIMGVVLTPGNFGKDCFGNGEHTDGNGNLIECCCDECDYMLCCFPQEEHPDCFKCTAKKCPRYKGYFQGLTKI